MRGSPIDPRTKAKFWRLRREGFSIVAAATEAKIGYTKARDLDKISSKPPCPTCGAPQD